MSTDRTPIDRAAEEMRERFGAPWMTHAAAHAVVSAALHDPDEDVLARTLRLHLGFHASEWDAETHVSTRWACTCGHDLGRVDVVAAFTAHQADAVRAAILGAGQ